MFINIESGGEGGIGFGGAGLRSSTVGKNMFFFVSIFVLSVWFPSSTLRIGDVNIHTNLLTTSSQRGFLGSTLCGLRFKCLGIHGSSSPFIVLGQLSSSANGQCHIVHALVEFFAKGQALRATGQSHLVHAPVEAYASVTRKSLRCVVLSSLDHINDPVIQD